MANNKDLFGATALNGADVKSGRGKKPAVEAPKPMDGGTPGESGYTAASIEVLEGLEPVRRRPGMYIGGTDETALHHLFAEVLDNAMDEAVAGHATRIDVAMDEDGFLSVTDNGRGIPVDPHPKFPKKSALEVIMTTLHAGGKFDSGAYQTSGGLHGVGVSVVNALSERLEVEVARGQTLYRQVFERGAPMGKLETVGRVANRRGTKVRFKARSADFRRKRPLQPGPPVQDGAGQGLSVRRRRNPLEMRRKPARSGRQDADRGGFPFSRRLEGLSGRRYRRQGTGRRADFSSARVEKPERHGSVEWAVAWLAQDDGFIHSYCNTIPTPDGGTHESGLRLALLRALKDHAERIGQGKRAGVITADDIMAGCAAMISIFIREPEFQGQNKSRLMSAGGLADRRERAARLLRPLARRLAGPGGAPARLGHRARRGAVAPPRRKKMSPAKAPCANYACPASSRIARTTPRKALNSLSSRAIPPAARPSRRATAPARPFCRCAEKSSTSPVPRAKSWRGNQQLADLIQALGCGNRRALSRTRTCATTRSSS